MPNGDMDTKFVAIDSAMKEAAKVKSLQVASSVAESLGVIEQKPDGTPSSRWEMSAEDLTLSFSWRFYDQSRPFVILPDMNVLSLTLRRGEEVLRKAEQRYED